MKTKHSHIIYKDADGNRELLELPTIQNLSIPDTNVIPSHPTITGQFRQQFTVTKAPKITFTMWLESGNYMGSTITTSKVIDVLNYLKKNKVEFNLTTTHSGEESRFLTDLVIEAITYNRSTTNRKRVSVNVSCTKLKMVELEWSMVDSVDIFGYNIFAGVTDAVKTEQVSFIPVRADDEFVIGRSFFGEFADDLKHSLYSSGKDRSVSYHVGQYIEENIPVDISDTIAYKLSNHLDMGDGNKIYVGSAKFPSVYGGASTPYEVKLVDLSFEVKVNETAEILPRIPLRQVLIEEDIGGYEDISDSPTHQYDYGPRYTYEFADTYPNFSPNQSFEYAADLTELREYIDENKNRFVRDVQYINNGNIMRDGHYIHTYSIPDRYNFYTRFGDSFERLHDPDGALCITDFELNAASNDFKVQVDIDEYQDAWDADFTDIAGNLVYKMYGLVVTLGTMVQVYLLAPSISNNDRVDDFG